MFFSSILLGGLAFSVIIFSFTQTEFDLLSHVSHSRIEFLLGILPLLWIVFVLLFLIFSYYIVRNTKTGYKYSVIMIFGGSIVLSILLGSILFYSGGGKKFEEIFSQNISFYEGIEEKKQVYWTTPEHGFLSGTIKEVSQDEEVITIKDFSQKNWVIHYKNTNIRQKVILKKGEKIKIIGEITKKGEEIEEKNNFSAQEIRPWNGTNKREN